MAGVEIDFVPGLRRGGFVEPRSAVTDSTGEASVTWVLGDVPGPQFLTAQARGASVEIAATVRPGDFDIQVVVDTLFTPEQEAAFRAAAERWAAVIVGDVPDQPFEEGYVPVNQCEGVEEGEIPPGGAVDDVLLAVTLVDDDRSRWGGPADDSCFRRGRRCRLDWVEGPRRESGDQLSLGHTLEGTRTGRRTHEFPYPGKRAYEGLERPAT